MYAYWVLAVSALAALASGCDEKERDVVIRGTLTWTVERQTIVPCGSDETLYVRVLASNPHFSLSQRVEKLTDSGGADEVIATLRGELSPGAPSVGPQYPVDGVLMVNEIQSVERGQCL